MNANKMFKALGYEIHYGSGLSHDVLCKVYIDSANWINIAFSHGGYRYLEYMNGVPINRLITKRTHNAITQQMKELGWLDE